MASGEVHRTQLAHERTYLAWWRTGLAAIAAGFAVGRVLPEVVGGTNWPYIALGTVLSASGLAAMVYGIVHYRELQAALREEREPHTGEGFVLALAAVGIVVGAASVLLVLLAPLIREPCAIAALVSGSRSRGPRACDDRSSGLRSRPPGTGLAGDSAICRLGSGSVRSAASRDSGDRVQREISPS